MIQNGPVSGLLSNPTPDLAISGPKICKKLIKAESYPKEMAQFGQQLGIQK